MTQGHRRLGTGLVPLRGSFRETCHASEPSFPFEVEIFVVRIRMKSFGRRHRPFFRICAMDSRTGRDGTAIEELGHYDPMVRNADARTVLKVSRIRYWLSVGAQPSEKVAALLRRAKVSKPAPGEDWKVDEPAPAPAQPVAGTLSKTVQPAAKTTTNAVPVPPVGEHVSGDVPPSAQ